MVVRAKQTGKRNRENGVGADTNNIGGEKKMDSRNRDFGASEAYRSPYIVHAFITLAKLLKGHYSFGRPWVAFLDHPGPASGTDFSAVAAVDWVEAGVHSSSVLQGQHCYHRTTAEVEVEVAVVRARVRQQQQQDQQQDQRGTTGTHQAASVHTLHSQDPVSYPCYQTRRRSDVDFVACMRSGSDYLMYLLRPRKFVWDLT